MRFNEPLNKKKLGEVDYGIFYSLFLLLAIGIVMIYSASSFYAMFKYKNSMYYLIRQGAFAIIGVIALVMMMKFDYHQQMAYMHP